MNILSFVATLALAISLMEGLYILLRDYRSASNRLFFFICLCIALWLLGGAFGYSSPTREGAFFWFRAASPGFIFMHCFVLHFTLRYTGVGRSAWTYLLYVPSLVFLGISFTDGLVFSDIYRSGNYWVMVPDYDALSFYLFIANYLGYYIVSLALLFTHMRKTHSIRIRGQSRVIFAAVVLTIASYNIEPFLAPLLFDYMTYGQAPIYSIVWVSLIWYAMTMYRFLGINECFLALDILNSVNVFIIVVDSADRIAGTNRVMREKLGRPADAVSLEEVFVEHKLIRRLLDSAGEQPLLDITLNLRLPGVETAPVNADISVFRDRFGDTVGYIITAREMPDRRSLLETNSITRREHQVIQLILSGNTNRQIAGSLGISLRTVETHITNIFSKLGLTTRTELVNYCTALFTPSDNPN